LRRPGKHNPHWETVFFNQGVFLVQATADGRYFVAMGDHGPGHEKRERLVKVFESPTGKEVLSISAEAFHLDATGGFMEFAPTPGLNAYSLFEIPSGKWVGVVDPAASALGPGGRLASIETANRRGFSLYRVGDKTPLVTLGIDSLSAEGYWAFSEDGARLAWGNQDGTVTVCYLAEVQRRLAALGFGW
jgi:hypothetical protein